MDSELQMPESESVARGEFFAAVEKGDVKEVAVLLAEGANPNWIDLRDGSGLRAIEMALTRKDLKMSRLLLSHGAFPVGLMQALKRGYAAGAKLLVESGADPNERDDAEERHDLTPLMLAARAGDLKQAKLLLELGADPNRVDDEGFSALAYARLRRSRPLQRLLEAVTFDELKKKAKKAFSERKLKRLHDDLIEAVKLRDMKQVRELIGQGVNPDGVGERWGEPATVTAAEVGDAEMLRLLLETGASPDGSGGWIPLTAAASGGSLDCVRLLLDAGADINQTGAILPAIAAAALAGRVSVVELLLQRGANPEQADGYGQTAQAICERALRRFPDHPTTPSCQEALALIETAIEERHGRR